MMRGVFLILFFLVFENISSQNWQQLSNFPAAGRDDGSVFIIGNNVYCGLGNASGIGPSTDFYKFSPLNDSWIGSVASLPAIGRQYCSSFSYNSFGYILGGVDANWNATNEVWRYDTLTNSWAQQLSIPDSVFGSVCFFINSKAYLCGGRDKNNNCTKKVWEYDVMNNTWLQKNNMPAGGRWRASGAVINNKGYLLFGADSANKFSNKLFEYDPSGDTWTLIDSFPGIGRTYSSGFGINNSFVIALGIDSNNTVYNDCYSYDINLHQWQIKNSLPTFGRKGCLAFTFNNSLYISAGIDGASNRLVETWKASNLNDIKFAESKSENLVIYPNPTTGVFTTKYSDLPKGNRILNVHDILGRLIASKKIDDNTDNTNLQIVTRGLYFVILESGRERFTQKVIVE